MDLEFSQTGASAYAEPEPGWPFGGRRGRELRCVVAIPVKDEVERLPACLAALAAQNGKWDLPVQRETYGIVVFANNCRDGSAEVARAIGAQLSLRLRVIEATLPASVAHAGGARRGAMDAAAQWLASEGAIDGVILTTDADSQVSAVWIANNLAAIDAGADAVLGAIQLDQEGDLLPEALHRRGRLESAYETLLAETSALIDPLPYDPWPHHSTISGASLAVTWESYGRVGGLPVVPLGEDKALVGALMRIGAKIRHSDDVLVTTSGRCQGRAPGGVADTLRLRSADPSALCDEALEPYRIAFLRAKWKERMRRLWRSRAPCTSDTWPRALRLSPDVVARALAATTFEATWEEIDGRSPRLIRRPLSPSELPREIALAQRIVGRLREMSLATNHEVNAEARMSIGALEPGLRVDTDDKKVSGLIA